MTTILSDLTSSVINFNPSSGSKTLITTDLKVKQAGFLERLFCGSRFNKKVVLENIHSYAARTTLTTAQKEILSVNLTALKARIDARLGPTNSHTNQFTAIFTLLTPAPSVPSQPQQQRRAPATSSTVAPGAPAAVPPSLPKPASSSTKASGGKAPAGVGSPQRALVAALSASTPSAQTYTLSDQTRKHLERYVKDNYGQQATFTLSNEPVGKPGERHFVCRVTVGFCNTKYLPVPVSMLEQEGSYEALKRLLDHRKTIIN